MYSRYQARPPALLNVIENSLIPSRDHNGECPLPGLLLPEAGMPNLHIIQVIPPVKWRYTNVTSFEHKVE
jgi:hypothetical protein